MRSTSYDFFDTLTLSVRGTGGRAVTQLREMYDHFEVPSVDDPDVVCELTTVEPDPEAVLGGPENYYGREGDAFVIRTPSGFLRTDTDLTRIQTSPNWEPFWTIYLVEFRIRQRLADRNRALVHASGVELDGHTTLFPAWRGAGKTNTLLSLLRAGGDYLSDDRLWVGADGSVQGYPLSVNMQPYNLESFPDLTLDDEPDEGIRQRVSDYIDANCEVGGSVVEKGLVFLNRYYLEADGRSFVDVEEMLPHTTYVDTGTVDDVVVLQAAPDADSVSVEPISPREAVTETATISSYEWNARLREYFMALDSLFPSQDWAGELETLIDTERRVFDTLYEQTGTYRASIPRDRDWNTTGISRQVVEAVRRLNTQADDATVSRQH